MISGDVLKYRNGFLIRECYETATSGSSEFPLTLPASYFDYYHRSRTYLSLGKDSPVHRPVESAKAGKIIALPQVGGLHHRYERLAA